MQRIGNLVPVTARLALVIVLWLIVLPLYTAGVWRTVRALCVCVCRCERSVSRAAARV